MSCCRRRYIRHTRAGHDVQLPRGLINGCRCTSRPARAKGALRMPVPVVCARLPTPVGGSEPREREDLHATMHNQHLQRTQREDSGGSRACENRGCLERREGMGDRRPQETCRSFGSRQQSRARSSARASQQHERSTLSTQPCARARCSSGTICRHARIRRDRIRPRQMLSGRC